MLDARWRQAIATITRDAKELFGPDLVCLVLYGSGAGPDFVPEVSDLNFAIVLDKIRFDHLRRLHPRLRQWHELGAAMPLLLDRESLERGRDVFPMEYQDIQESHELLAGEDVFAALRIDPRHLRYQAELELRGKLLRLRALLAEVGADDVKRRHLLRDSVKTFLVILRALVRLRQAKVARTHREALAQFEASWGCSLPALKRALAIRNGAETWPRSPALVDALLQEYLADIERLTAIVDAMGPG